MEEKLNLSRDYTKKDFVNIIDMLYEDMDIVNNQEDDFARIVSILKTCREIEKERATVIKTNEWKKFDDLFDELSNKLNKEYKIRLLKKSVVERQEE